MNSSCIDGLLRALGDVSSRRSRGRALAGGGLGALVVAALGPYQFSNTTEARGKKKATKHKKNRRRGQRQSQVPPVPPVPVPAYQCSGPQNSLVLGDGSLRFAQSFTAKRSGSLRQIQFSVDKRTATSGDYVVQLLRVVNGKPSHSPVDVLATATVPDANVAVSGAATVTATFTGPTLVAGTEYAAAFSRPGAAQAAAISNTVKGNPGACGGKLFLAVGGDVFAEEILGQDSVVSVLVV